MKTWCAPRFTHIPIYVTFYIHFVKKKSNQIFHMIINITIKSYTIIIFCFLNGQKKKLIDFACLWLCCIFVLCKLKTDSNFIAYVNPSNISNRKLNLQLMKKYSYSISMHWQKITAAKMLNIHVFWWIFVYLGIVCVSFSNTLFHQVIQKCLYFFCCAGCICYFTNVICFVSSNLVCIHTTVESSIRFPGFDFNFSCSMQKQTVLLLAVHKVQPHLQWECVCVLVNVCMTVICNMFAFETITSIFAWIYQCVPFVVA